MCVLTRVSELKVPSSCVIVVCVCMVYHIEYVV
jgi:hypothetical protein